MREWESSIDRQIRKAMEEGEFTNLPGEGKPLNLNDDPNTPDHMQLAFKILRENDLAPDWIVQGKELEARCEKWLEKLKQAFNAYQAGQSDPARSTKASVIWTTAQQKLMEDALRLNKEIVTYNLKIPAGITHRGLLNIQREIQRLSSAA